MTMDKKFLTEREAAEYLRLSPKTLRRWRKAGAGPRFVRIGGTAIRYSTTEIESFVATEGSEHA